MKSISLIALLLLSSSFALQTATAVSLLPFPFPLPAPFSLPSIFGKGNDSELARMCFPDLGDGEACMAEIFGSFFNRQIRIGPECCKAIVEIDQHCAQALFKPFSNSFFGSSVKQYCSYTNN